MGRFQVTKAFTKSEKWVSWKDSRKSAQRSAAHRRDDIIGTWLREGDRGGRRRLARLPILVYSIVSYMPLTIRAAVRADAAAIADIYNQGIAERGATFETEPRTAADIEARIDEGVRFPMLVAEADGEVIGWAGASSYRPRACYAGSGEVSVYLDRTARGRGVGRQLLAALIDSARERGYWKLVSRVFPFNTASRALCRACGFREVGVYERHGCLDGKWLDVVIVERLIPENLR
jgi:phosphinothricin acetyltransferase